jgi:hypothetical protein
LSHSTGGKQLSRPTGGQRLSLSRLLLPPAGRHSVSRPGRLFQTTAGLIFAFCTPPSSGIWALFDRCQPRWRHRLLCRPWLGQADRVGFEDLVKEDPTVVFELFDVAIIIIIVFAVVILIFSKVVFVITDKRITAHLLSFIFITRPKVVVETC